MARVLTGDRPRTFTDVPQNETFANVTVNDGLTHKGTSAGFYNVAPIAKPTALTVVTTQGISSIVAEAPLGGVGASAGAWDTAANRDAAITTINNTRTRAAQAITIANNTRTRLTELEARLRDLGLIT